MAMRLLFHALPDGPGQPERVFLLALETRPDSHLERGWHLAAGGDGAVPPLLRVIDMDMHVEALRLDRGKAVVGEEVAKEDHAAIDLERAVHQLFAVFGLDGLMLDGAEGGLVEVERLSGA